MDQALFEKLLYTFIILAISVTGAVLYRKEIAFMLRAKKVKGQIVNWMSAVIGGKRYYFPMIEYTPSGFERQLFRAEDRCEGEPMFEPGTEVTVKYLESDLEYRKVIYPKK
jgi:Mor family transcriptional regulator